MATVCDPAAAKPAAAGPRPKAAEVEDRSGEAEDCRAPVSPVPGAAYTLEDAANCPAAADMCPMP